MSLEKLQEYVHNEKHIRSLDSYNDLIARYPNDESLTLYRGINFSSEEKYKNFIKKMNDDSGYLTSRAAGFSSDYETAKDFCYSTKTYYPSKDIVSLDHEMKKTGDILSGYCGILLKIEVEPNQVIDVNSTGVSIENEYLFRPNEIIKCEISEIIYSHKVTLANNFNINEYLLDLDNTNNSLFDYIIRNNSESLNKDNIDSFLVDVLNSNDNPERAINYLSKVYKLSSQNNHLNDRLNDFIIKNFKNDNIVNLLEIVKPNNLLKKGLNIYIKNIKDLEDKKLKKLVEHNFEFDNEASRNILELLLNEKLFVTKKQDVNSKINSILISAKFEKINDYLKKGVFNDLDKSIIKDKADKILKEINIFYRNLNEKEMDYIKCSEIFRTHNCSLFDFYNDDGDEITYNDSIFEIDDELTSLLKKYPDDVFIISSTDTIKYKSISLLLEHASEETSQEYKDLFLRDTFKDTLNVLNDARELNQKHGKDTIAFVLKKINDPDFLKKVRFGINKF